MRTSFRCTSPNTHQGAEGQKGGGERDPLTSDRPTHRFPPPSTYVCKRWKRRRFGQRGGGTTTTACSGGRAVGRGRRCPLPMLCGQTALLLLAPRGKSGSGAPKRSCTEEEDKVLSLCEEDVCFRLLSMGKDQKGVYLPGDLKSRSRYSTWPLQGRTNLSK